MSGLDQTDPVRKQAGVQESSGPLLAHASHLIRTGSGMFTGISFSTAALESSSVGETDDGPSEVVERFLFVHHSLSDDRRCDISARTGFTGPRRVN